MLIGEVPERSKGADCKSVGYAFEGPNPSLSIMASLTGGFIFGRLSCSTIKGFVLSARDAGTVVLQNQGMFFYQKKTLKMVPIL